MKSVAIILLLGSLLILADRIGKKNSKDLMSSELKNKDVTMQYKARHKVVDSCPVMCEDSSGTKFCCKKDKGCCNKECCTENKRCCKKLNVAEKLIEDVHENETKVKRLEKVEIVNEITVLALAVGQGDSTLIVCPNDDLVIIDMGSSSKSNSSALTKTDIQNILKKYVTTHPSSKFRIVVTHPDKDHYNYFQDVFSDSGDLQKYVEYFVLSGNFGNYTINNFNAWLKTKFPGKIFSVNRGSACFGNDKCKIYPFETPNPVMNPQTLCDNDSTVIFTILAANLGASKNSQSVVIKMQYGSISMLLPGDFETDDAQKSIISHYNGTGQLHASVYKIAHHGASTLANNGEFLNEIKPEAAFTSQAYPTNRNFAHPRCDVIDDLLKLITINASSPHPPFACGISKQPPRVYTQWKNPIYETCNEPNKCNNIEIKLTKTSYSINHDPIRPETESAESEINI